MVPTCSSGTLTNVLPHRTAMSPTQDMTSHPVLAYIQTQGRPVVVLSIDLERHTGIHHYTLVSLVRPVQEILPRPPTHTSERSTL